MATMRYHLVPSDSGYAAVASVPTSHAAADPAADPIKLSRRHVTTGYLHITWGRNMLVHMGINKHFKC